MTVSPLDMPAVRPGTVRPERVLSYSTTTTAPSVAARDEVVLQAALAEGKGLGCDRYGIGHLYQSLSRGWMECVRPHCGKMHFDPND